MIMRVTNRFPFSNLWWLGILGIALGLVLALATYSLGRALRPPQVLRGAMLNPPQPAVDFRLPGSGGKNYSLYEFRGVPVLLAFSCQSCSRSSALLQQLAQATDLVRNAGNDAQGIIISIDPERETPEAMTTFVQSFDRSFVGLSGDPKEIRDLAHSYDIYFGSSIANDGKSLQVEHTPLIMLIDGNGYWRAVYPINLAPEDIAADINILFAEGK
jgi:protein SCO1/2